MAAQDYTFQEKEYKAEQAGVQALVKHIHDTLDTHYVRICCKANKGVASWYKKLMVKLEPSEEVAMEIARKIYTDAVRPLKTGPRDWEGFVRR